MKKFEYCRLECVRLSDDQVAILIEPDGNLVDIRGQKMTVVLNELGQHGWELVSASEMYHGTKGNTVNCILKREIV